MKPQPIPGNASMNVAPWSGFAVAQSRPRWLSMIERLIERPMIRPLAGGLSSWRAHGFPVQPLVAASRARTWPDWTRFAPKLDLQCTVPFIRSIAPIIGRLLGTFAAAVWGASVTLAIPHRDILSLGLALAVALAPLALVAALKPSYRVAPVTAIIVLLSTTGVQLGSVRYAVDRVLEIGLGCVVGFAVSLLILPARAHRLLAEAAGQVLLALRDLLNLLLQDLPRTPDRTAVAATHLRLSRALSGVEGLVDEVRRERNNRLTDAPDPEPAARTLRRLRHDLTAVGRAVTESLPHPACLYLEEATGGLRRGISDYL